MKALNIIFLYFPTMLIACESSKSPREIHNDPETGDLREYARITLRPSQNWFDGKVTPAGALTWTKHAHMLTEEQTGLIVSQAKKIETQNNNTK